ncbi:hypothetical protein ACF0H5_002995 [Mactra antiquata]
MDPSINPDASGTGVPVSNESCDEVSERETSPSSVNIEQEVNKPLVDDESNIVNSESENLNSNGSATAEQTNLLANGNAEAEQSTNAQVKKGKKNVNFPVDSTIIKSYLEPPDPWKNVPNWRTEDLMKAYRKSCERHGAKPLNKILQQLQCIENVGERYEILSLKGERLDLKQCESLEDIFRFVRFRCIDLEATHLDDEMAVAIFEMVEYYESACKLNISFNKGIGPRGWMSCSRLVRKTPCLTFIDARNCDLNERLIPIMGRALRMGCYLQRLHLQSTGLSGRALVILVAALKMNEILKELFLGDNKFMPTDGVQIGNLLKYNHSLELLDLRNNHLQDVGITHICDGLSEQCLDTGLLTLVLWNNQITFQGMSAINKAVTSAEHLETLNLGHNPITNEGIHILKDGLLKTKSLLKLGLSGTKVSCEGAVALAEVIADNTRLVRLDLQENDIKTAGLMALSLAMKVNESITRLDIDRDTKKESGVKDYADQQKRLQKDITTLLDRNRDILRHREEEQRQLEIRNQENARKLEEAARDIENSHEYIPSGDSIHRPKLLCIPHTHLCPEHELDSPVLGNEFFLDASSPVTSVTLTAPAGAELLSPQYCPNPKVTAKKIFSVTRVTSPTSESSFMLPNYGSVVTDVINSPTQVHPAVRNGTDQGPVLPQLCSPLPTVELPTLSTTIPLTVNLPTTQSPDSLQKALEEHTLVSYIQQIVDIPKTTDTDEISEPTDTETVQSVASINISNNASSSNEDNTSETNDLGATSTKNNEDNSEGSGKNESGTSNVDDDDKIENTNTVKVSSESEIEGINTQTNETISSCDSQCVENGIDKENCSSSVENQPQTLSDITNKQNTEVVNVKNVQITCSKTSNTDNNQPSQTVSISDDNSVDTGKIPPESLSEFNMPSNEDYKSNDINEEINGDFVDCIENNTDNKVDNEYNQTNVDNEPWDTVNKSDLEVDNTSLATDNNKIVNCNNPDFHTNLSFNGLRQELASLIDEEGNSVPAVVQEVANGSIPTDTETNTMESTDIIDENNITSDMSTLTS